VNIATVVSCNYAVLLEDKFHEHHTLWTVSFHSSGYRNNPYWTMLLLLDPHTKYLSSKNL